MTRRLFIAINLPINVKNVLKNSTNALQQKNRHIRVRWVDPNILHLTLNFLGNVDIERMKELKTLIQINAPCFKAQLDNLGGFPDSNRPQVIYALLKSENLIKIQSLIKSRLLNKGFDVSLQRFKPHITLGRINVPQVFKGLDDKIEEIEFMVKSIDLMASELLPNGPKYEILCPASLE